MLGNAIYAAGPMEGLTLEQMTGWRKLLRSAVEAHNDARVGFTESSSDSAEFIRLLDPCDREEFHELSKHSDPLSTARRIVKLDELDVLRSRVVFMNLEQIDELGLRAWGSICELAFAAANRIPVVLVLPKPTSHPFVLSYATEIYTDFDQAVKAALSYFR